MTIKPCSRWRWKHAPDHEIEVQQASDGGVLYITESGTMMCMARHLFESSFEPVEDALCELQKEVNELRMRVAELESKIHAAAIALL